MKFKFEATEEDNSKVTHEFEALRWDEALNQFVKFLRGSGYCIHDDSIGVNSNRIVSMHDDWELNNITFFEQE